MMHQSLIPAALLTAYKNTTYIINEAGDSVFIGKLSPAVDLICKEVGAESWLFITPYNPRSEVLSKAENESRMNKLKNILLETGLTFSEGEGQGEDAWEPERSVFVPGVSRELAIELGKEFEQYAVVFGEVGKEAELLEIPLRPRS
jgi:hypothetical protein